MKPDEKDELLNRALARYSSVEPRPGLEDRILHRLASPERKEKPWNWMALAVAAAVVVVAAGVITVTRYSFPGSRKSEPVAQNPPRVPSKQAEVAKTVPQPAEIARPRRLREPSPHTSRHANRISKTNALAAAPRREQFPTPTPLSPEEALLFKFLRTTPKEELLAIAAEQEKQQLRALSPEGEVQSQAAGEDRGN